MFFDADHGKRLTDALDDMVAKNADLVFLEGFTDMAENAAYWRSTDNIYYDFPNQRLNILRKYSSSRAWAESFRVEMEACDYFFDVSAKNSGNQYRTGSLDVAKIAGVARIRTPNGMSPAQRRVSGWNGKNCLMLPEISQSRYVMLPKKMLKSVLTLAKARKEDKGLS